MDISSLIDQACFLLSQGKLVIMPTETVYGLAADATHDFAVAGIYKLKNRPAFNPLIVHVGSIDQAKEQAFFSEKAFLLARHFWGQKGGPLTLVLKRKNPHLSHLVTAGLNTVAVRMPSHPMALDLLKTYPNPLAAPSANRSEALSPTSFQAVQESFGDETPFGLDGGPCQVGLESTILDLSGSTPILLRPGGISVEQIEYVLGKKIEIYKGSAIQAPGMTKRHYAPKTPLRLNATNKKNDEAFLGFGPGTEDFETLNLSPQGDDVEAASHLFAMLRELDHQKVSSIAVAPIPTSGLGLAINDRLQRAAFNETKG
jgi:L-threonylcarbamoyladenylate synthase